MVSVSSPFVPPVPIAPPSTESPTPARKLTDDPVGQAILDHLNAASTLVRGLRPNPFQPLALEAIVAALGMCDSAIKAASE
jgi:hypothetical protein